MAGLTAVQHQPVDVLGHRPTHVGIVEHDVRRFAAEFLMHAFDAVGSALGDIDSCRRRPGEGDHIDVRVLGDRRADGGASSINEIIDALGSTGLMQDLGNDMSGERRNLRRLVDHRVTSRQSRYDLAHDLVDRPIPGRHHSDHTDGLPSNHCARPLGVFERIGFQCLDGGLEVKEADSRLHFLRELCWGPEFLHESVRQVLVTTCIGRQHAVQKIGAFLTGGLGRNAVLAAATARSTSAALPSAICPASCSVTGLMTSIISPLVEATHAPSI
jgi:hypothetical protein